MIVVIADDFSGAAEIAGVAHRCGLTVEVQTVFRPSAADVIVVDTATRSLSAREAAERTGMIASAVRRSNPRWVYKKIDSVLRGAVVGETTAAAEQLGYRRMLVVNANPRRGRRVIGGVLSIAGLPPERTTFAEDPEHPCRSSLVAELLGLDASALTCVDPGEFPAVDSFAVGNAGDAGDLTAHARSVRLDTMAAGGAEFFEALLKVREAVCPSRAFTALRLGPGTVIACGSLARPDEDHVISTRSAFSLVEATNGAASLVRGIVEGLTAGDPVGVAVANDRHLTLSPGEAVDLLAQGISGALDRGGIRRLLIAGGRTASEIVRRRRWNCLAVECCFADGVVALRPESCGEVQIVVKPGSYPWPPVLDENCDAAAEKAATLEGVS